MVKLSIQGHASSIDFAAIARTDATCLSLLERMTTKLKIPKERAPQILEAMMSRAVLRYGEHLIAGKTKLIDRIVELRNKLDDVYEAAFTYNAKKASGIDASSAAIEGNLQEISQLFEQLDADLKKLGQPWHEVDPPPGTGDVLSPLLDEIGGTKAKPAFPDTPRRTTTHDTTPGPTGSVRIESGRYKFKLLKDGSYKKLFTDKASAVFRIVGGKYVVDALDAAGRKIGQAIENTVLHTPYGRRFRTTALMQANHGYQNSIMTRLFKKFGYDGEAVPTIWMRNSRQGSPHGLVTAEQAARKSAGQASGVTLEKIREWTIADLRHGGVPDVNIAEYLLAIDNHFMVRVYPNIPANQRKALLGNWKAGAGL